MDSLKESITSIRNTNKIRTCVLTIAFFKTLRETQQSVPLLCM